MGCCNKDNEKTPDDVDTCCGIRGKRCICLPYDDGFAILAQILTIIALFFSWIWWPTLIISILGMILFQIFWCCRQTSCSLYLPTAVAAIASLASLNVAIYAFVRMRSASYCIPFVMYQSKYIFDDDALLTLNDDEYINYLRNLDDCREKTWGIIATICSALWAAAAICLFWFVKSGRHARWEEIYSGRAPSNDVELARSNSEESPVVIADVAIMPPESMDNKVDEV